MFHQIEHIQAVGIAKEEWEGDRIELATGMVGLFESIPSDVMAEAQHSDNQILPVLKFVESEQKPHKKVIYQTRSNNARKLVLQWDPLTLKKGVLHRLYVHNEIKYHQLVLPQKYHRKVLAALHDNMGHQGIDCTLNLLQERVYWPSMAQDAQQWVARCRHCQLARSDYTGPKPKIGHLEANNPLDLVCLDFTKVDPSKSGKECAGHNQCLHEV